MKIVIRKRGDHLEFQTIREFRSWAEDNSTVHHIRNFTEAHDIAKKLGYAVICGSQIEVQS
jgi:hypothetical protein